MRRFFPTLVLICLLQLRWCAGTAILAQQSKAIGNQRPSVIVGVLEDLPGHYSGEPNFRAVRVVFQKIGGDWSAFPTKCMDQQSLKTLTKSYPAEVSWTIAFDGKNEGRLTSHAPDDFAWYSDIGLEKILDSETDSQYRQTIRGILGLVWLLVYRLLVAVPKPNFRDPNDWSDSQLTPGQIATLRLTFRKRFPKVLNCSNPEENLESWWKYRDDDIRIGATYSSTNHWQLAELNLEGYACDGPNDDGGSFDSQWYVVDPAGRIRHLGSGMWLVDAGDYDNDGSLVLICSEWYKMRAGTVFITQISARVLSFSSTIIDEQSADRSAKDFEGAGRRRVRTEIGVEAEVQFGGFRHAAFVPGRIKDDFDFDFAHLRQCREFSLDFGFDHIGHTAAGSGEGHAHIDALAACDVGGSGRVDQAEIDDVDRYLGIADGLELLPDHLFAERAGGGGGGLVLVVCHSCANLRSGLRA